MLEKVWCVKGWWGRPNQLTAMERPTSTPKTSPRSWTSAFAVFATPDCRCWVASSRMPIVSVIPGRSVTSAARVTTSGEIFSPSCGEERRREAGCHGCDRSEHLLRPRGCPAGGERDEADEQADHAARESRRASHRRARARRQRRRARRRRAEPATGGRAVEPGPPPAGRGPPRGLELAAEDVLHELVEASDRVQIDRRRADAKSEGPLPRDRSERDVDDRGVAET